MNRGFTIIELIVTTTIIATLTIAVVTNYNTYSDRQKVKQAMLTFKTNLRYAQRNALSGQKPMTDCTTLDGWRVDFAPSGVSYGITPVCLGVPVTSETIGTQLPAGVVFSPVPPSLFFQPIKGLSLATDQQIILVGPTASYGVIVGKTGSVAECTVTAGVCQ